MKRLLTLLLCLVTLLSLVACAKAPAETTAPETEPSQPPESTGPIDDYPYPKINEKLTWDAINAFPIKRSDMTVAEMRQLCVDFFRFEKSFLWIPNNDMKYPYTKKDALDEIKKGSIYGGLPYITVGSGNVYRVMDYINEETGVVDIRKAMSIPTLFGNQCSGAAYWAWGRVINSPNYGYTSTFVSKNGFIKLGPYTYDENISGFELGTDTINICKANGDQIMFQSYALLQPADGLVQWTTAGHVIMSTSAAHVEYTDDGKIDGEKSYITICEQSTKWLEGTNDSGDAYQYKASHDKKMTFAALFKGYYIPFTFAEFLGTDPVEDTVCTFSHTGDTITTKELFKTTITANYGICDAYASVKDSTGKEVYRHAVRTKETGQKELDFTRAGNVDKWGTLDVSNGVFTVEVTCQLATGERPVIYTGKLVP